MDEICGIAERENVNAVIIAGDLFDNFNPTVEAVDLFYKTLKRLAANGTRAVIAIAGNHDSPDRIEAPDPLARECGIIFAGFPNICVVPFSLDNGIAVTKSDKGFIEIKVPDVKYPLRLLLTPYANEYRLKTFLGIEDAAAELRNVLAEQWQKLADQYCDKKGVNMLVAHLYLMEKDGLQPAEPDDEKPILHIGGTQAVYSENVPEQMQYVALGHLHAKQIVDIHPCPILYSSSPLAYSFSEANQAKFVVLIDAEPAKPVKYNVIPLTKGKKLLRAKFSNVDTAIQWLEFNPNTLVELTMVSDTFLKAEDRKRLYAAHDGIVNIVPEVKNIEAWEKSRSVIDISNSIEVLFADYFKQKYNQEPNERLMALFKEVLAAEENT